MATTSTDGPARATPAPDRPSQGFLPALALNYFRTPRQPRFLAELILMAVGYGVYSLIRNAVPEHQAHAIARSVNVWQLEQSLNIDFELWLNHTVHAISWLAVTMSYFYAFMHFVVTGAVLFWLYWRHPGRYRATRTVLAITTALALFGYFLYPLAPPRLLPDGSFFDTVLLYDTWGSMASGDLQSLSNQYAAMPSMHAGWSLWCGIAIVIFARHRWLKVAGVLYPLITVVVITATANHYVLDAAGGWLTLGAGFVLQRVLHGRYAHTFNQHLVAVT